jgi:hypothetical protein
VAYAALTAALVACDRLDVAASLGPGGQFTNGPLGQRPEALVGRWSHIETTPDGGVVRQTSWEFAGDGTAARTITARTALGATLDSGVVEATWIATPGVLTLRFGAPSFSILRVSYVIDYGVATTTLFLDGVPYERVI